MRGGWWCTVICMGTRGSRMRFSMRAPIRTMSMKAESKMLNSESYPCCVVKRMTFSVLRILASESRNAKNKQLELWFLRNLTFWILLLWKLLSFLRKALTENRQCWIWMITGVWEKHWWHACTTTCHKNRTSWMYLVGRYLRYSMKNSSNSYLPMCSREKKKKTKCSKNNHSSNHNRKKEGVAPKVMSCFQLSWKSLKNQSPSLKSKKPLNSINKTRCLNYQRAK